MSYLTNLGKTMDQTTAQGGARIPLTGIRVDILKHGGRSFANGGISDTSDEATLILDSKLVPLAGTEASDEAPAIKLVKGNLPGTIKAVPVVTPSGVLGPMMGGSYVVSSDGRFADEVERILGYKSSAPVPLHDRFETQAQYDAHI